MKILSLGGSIGSVISGNKQFTGNVDIDGTLNVDGVATFVTTVTGSGNIMAGAAFALGFTGRGQFKSPSDGLIDVYLTDGATRGRLGVGLGAVGTPSIAFPGISATAAGFWGVSGALQYAYNGAAVFGFYGSGSGTSEGLILISAPVRFGTSISNGSAGLALVSGSTCGVVGSTATALAGFQPAKDANGATLQILAISELLTLSTSGTTTDTTANLLPAGAIIKTVVGRVTTTITTATDWQIGDPTTAGRFTPANATMTAGTTDIGRVHMTTGIASATTGIYQAAAAKVRITTTGTPGAGAIRLTTFYELLTPPTS